MRDLVSIIIPAYNQIEYCRQCIASVLAHTAQPYQLILVDNGSTDGVGAFFDQVPQARVIHTGRNTGFAAGVNRGLAVAEGHALLLNSDTLVPPGWLDRLMGAMHAAPDIAMVGPMTNCASGSQQVDGLQFGSLDDISQFASDWARRNAGRLRDVARLVAFCVLIRDHVWKEIGPFDERYGIGNFEDDDYCLQVLRAGYRLCVAEEAFVFHYGSRTFLGMKLTDDAWTELMRRNEALFHEKWRVKPQERLDAAQASRRLNVLARQKLETNDVAGALGLLKQAIEVFPWLDTNYTDVGNILLRLGEPARARRYFERARELDPERRPME